jgi:putative transposase
MAGDAVVDQAGTVCRAVTYRLVPTRNQHIRLCGLLASQRHLYNAALEHRRGAWKWGRESVTKFDQFKLLTGAQAEIPSLAEFGLQVHRGTLARLNEAFSHFFRRVKAGQTPGFPRFRNAARFDSVQWPEATGWKLYQVGAKGTYGRLAIMGVGHVSVKLHRHMGDAVATKLVVRRKAGGKLGHTWEATVFYKDVTAKPAPASTGVAAAVDRGVTVLGALAATDGTEVLEPNPGHLRSAHADLVRRQQRLARTKRGSKRRERARAEVARAHRKVADARKDRNHQLSARLVRDYDTVVLEDLTITNMTRSATGTLANPGSNVAAKAGLNRSILDAGWGQLARMLTDRAAEAGRTIIAVNPRHTSQTCSQCGHVDPGNRNGVAFRCTACSHEAHADLNAAHILLQRAGFETPLGVSPDASRPGSGHARAA